MASIQEYIKEKNNLVSYIKWLDILNKEDGIEQERITKAFNKISNEIKLGKFKNKDEEIFFTFLGEDGDVPYISVKRDKKGIVKMINYFIKPDKKTTIKFLTSGVISVEKKEMSRYPNHYKKLEELFMNNYVKDNKGKAVEYRGLVIVPYQEYSILKEDLRARDGYDMLGDKIMSDSHALSYFQYHYKLLGIKNFNDYVFKVISVSSKSKSRLKVGDYIVSERGELYQLNVN